ncbi:carbamoyl-phosphate synthase (glutamine-hydrolyzing) [Synergistales bacterium]|nr:carbamoyl-phosphate synthase (glutamine-hydrolyzing) [Synergistales bacterium]
MTLAMQLARPSPGSRRESFLEQRGVKLLGASPETIDKAEDRQIFKNTMEKLGQPCVPSVVVTDVNKALAFAEEIGYPVVVRPAFTLGGTGGGIAPDAGRLRQIASNGLRLSPIGQALIEKSVAGWKEIEYEVMRDAVGNVITVCSMENLDPVGVHTGDSIVVAPALTLSDKEYQMLRTASLDIISDLKIEGGCNCQFALNPGSMEYAVIEVNPRVSRSSALASKATGYPIAKVAARIAIGYTLDEIPNAVTGKTCACFEPALDYVAVKFPKWPFDKFVYSPRTLGTQMKATGEVMSLSDSFESALMKAVRGAEISLQTLRLPKLASLSDEALLQSVATATDERLFQVFELLSRGVSCEKINAVTKIDMWFLRKIQNLAEYEKQISSSPLSTRAYLEGKRLGYTDAVLEKLSGRAIPERLVPVYNMVDTCAAEFEALTPYFYASTNFTKPASVIDAKPDRDRPIVVLGSGPIRIGQGIEFDYSSVQCVKALKKLGHTVVTINNNPETVSTDFDTSDRLYFEPLTPEDVLNILERENPKGVVVAYGGQTAIKLTNVIARRGWNILGTPSDSIDMAEDRERFDALLEELHIMRPEGASVMNTEEALSAARRLGYPVLVRPSYVLGGQNMNIAFSDDDVREFMKIILSHGIEKPVLVDKYLKGIEIEVDAICDGHDILIPGIMEHIERTGIHSGDSIAVYPARHIDDRLIERVVDHSRRLALALKTRGLVNIQYIVYENETLARKQEIYVIEVNPRASRTVPYITKVTGVPMVELATRAMLGEKLGGMGYGTGLYPPSPYVAVKVPVFSFEKLHDVDTQLGPEMKSTGEVLGIGKTFEEAMFKGLTAAGYKTRRDGGVFLSVRDNDKDEIVDVAKKYAQLDFPLYATKGTAAVLSAAGLASIVVPKIHEAASPQAWDTLPIVELLESGKVRYVVSTSARGRDPARDSVKIRSLATRLGIPCLTSIDTAMAVAESLHSRYEEKNTELVDINYMRASRKKITFVKMHSCGKDDIYFDCFNAARGQEIDSPESLAVMFADRHRGVGSYGVALICPPDDKSNDARMRMFNMDGSEGLMSGSAIACIGMHVYEKGYTSGRKLMRIETWSGVKELEVFTRYGHAFSARVNMGKPRFEPASIPVRLDGDRVIGRAVNIGDLSFSLSCVSMGNPHCVLFRDDVDMFDISRVGPLLECASIFPERANVEFARVLDDETIRMRIWERGDGETPASGTGSCAVAVAAVENGLCPPGRIRVIQPGGEMYVEYDGKTVHLSCEVHVSFEGQLEI